VLIVRALAACPIGQLDRQPHSPANQQNESNCVEGCQVSFQRTTANGITHCIAEFPNSGIRNCAAFDRTHSFIVAPPSRDRLG
jgi:hypothetical protein